MNPNFKTILLTTEQVKRLEQIQASERQRSSMGSAPSVHAIARHLIDQALGSKEVKADGTN
ncbi:hypothetical protein JK229_12510 [Pantoea dispersa]|uniref:hypothetical protein n=1 Tax=Pantoea dispersa TaxID=59814 RepID=UPI001BA8DD18|nr:hypothetical protein [Pantoea dispersa]MBS0905950.1 hypothetical protein [Pantoea dispersa]